VVSQKLTLGLRSRSFRLRSELRRDKSGRAEFPRSQWEPLAAGALLVADGLCPSGWETVGCGEVGRIKGERSPTPPERLSRPATDTLNTYATGCSLECCDLSPLLV